MLETRQAGNTDSMRWLIGNAAPEPELKLDLRARGGATADEVAVEGGNVGHGTYPVATEVQRDKRRGNARWRGGIEHFGGIFHAGNQGTMAEQRAAKADQQTLLIGADFQRFDIEAAFGLDVEISRRLRQHRVSRQQGGLQVVDNFVLDDAVALDPEPDQFVARLLLVAIIIA